MVKVYQESDYKRLAQSVLAGFPMEEAEKILAIQREQREQEEYREMYKGLMDAEQNFWLELKKGNASGMTTIQVSKETKAKLEELKQDKETFEDVISSLIPEVREIGAWNNVKVKNSISNIESLLIKKIFGEDNGNTWISLRLCRILKINPEYIDINCVVDETGFYVENEDVPTPHYYLTRDEFVKGQYCEDCKEEDPCKKSNCKITIENLLFSEEYESLPKQNDGIETIFSKQSMI